MNNEMVSHQNKTVIFFVTSLVKLFEYSCILPLAYIFKFHFSKNKLELSFCNENLHSDLINSSESFFVHAQPYPIQGFYGEGCYHLFRRSRSHFEEAEETKNPQTRTNNLVC